jgi:hypothetical protein
MSAALHVKLFNQFKEITDAARSAVSRHILPLLEGFRVSGEHDKTLAELYEEWQAGCRAAAASLQRTLYSNEYEPMPQMPVDDEEHQPCRQMAAVLIERTVYDEHIAQKWFRAAVQNMLNNPACANHRSSCACKMALKGWKDSENQHIMYHIKAFYEAHYDADKNEDNLDDLRSAAKRHGRTVEQQIEHQRMVKEEGLMRLATFQAKKAIDEEAKAQALKGCVFICYQDLSLEDLKAYNLHGWYKVTKTAECYEFMLMDTNLQDPFWRKAEVEHKVTKIPLHVKMGMRSTSFEAVTPDKIHS